MATEREEQLVSRPETVAEDESKAANAPPGPTFLHEEVSRNLCASDANSSPLSPSDVIDSEDIVEGSWECTPTCADNTRKRKHSVNAIALPSQSSSPAARRSWDVQTILGKKKAHFKVQWSNSWITESQLLSNKATAHLLKKWDYQKATIGKLTGIRTVGESEIVVCEVTKPDGPVIEHVRKVLDRDEHRAQLLEIMRSKLKRHLEEM